jgi:multidrug efflux pump subunit AcrA (membrane-fusion protein)
MSAQRAIVYGFLLACLGCRPVVGEATPGQRESDGNPAAVNVRVEAAQEQTIPQTVWGLGRIEAPPGGIGILAALVEGRVAKLLAEPGAEVTAGQPIVALEEAASRANYEEKVALCDSQKASLELLLSRPRPEEQENAKLAIEQARVSRAKARAAVDRLRPLRKRNDIPEQELYEAQLALDQAVLQEKTAESQYRSLMLLPRPQAIDEARSRVTVAERALAGARVQLEQHTIRSPLRGRLDGLSCQLGQTVAVGTVVGQVVDLHRVHLVFWLPVPEAQLLHEGQPARVTPGSSSAPDQAGAGQGDAIGGRVCFLGQAADAQTGNLPLRIAIDDPQGRLRLGQMASASIVVGRPRGLAVPLTAVYDTGQGPSISVVREGKTVVRHPTLGQSDRRWVLAAGTDLKPGEPVVVEGGYNLPDGTKVLTDTGH